MTPANHPFCFLSGTKAQVHSNSFPTSRIKGKPYGSHPRTPGDAWSWATKATVSNGEVRNILGVASPFPGIRISFSSNHQKPWGSSWCLKRTIVEKNGESTPRYMVLFFVLNRSLLVRSMEFGASRTVRKKGYPQKTKSPIRHLVVSAVVSNYPKGPIDGIWGFKGCPFATFAATRGVARDPKILHTKPQDPWYGL